MWDFNLLAATRTIENNMAFVLRRWLIYLGVGLAYIFGALIGAGTAIGAGSLSLNPAAFATAGAWLGVAVAGWILYKSRHWFLTGVHALNLALIAAEAMKLPVPKGKAQIDFARERFAERIPDTALLKHAMARVRGVLYSLPGWRQPRPESGPQQWLRNTKGWLTATDDLILLGYHFTRPGKTIWQSAREGLLIHAAHTDKLLRNRLYLFAFGWLGCFATYPVLLIPLQNAAAILPINPGPWPYIFALLLAWTIKAAFLDAIAAAAMIEVFLALPSSENDTELDEALSQASPDFADIRTRAGE